MLKVLSTMALVVCLAGCQSLPPGAPDLARFTTDGCSLFPDRSSLSKTDWCACCLAHDLAYWRGGTFDERLAADRALQACVGAAAQGAVLPQLMYAGVRVGGAPVLPTPFRWGYGWPYGRLYQPLTSSDEAQVSHWRAVYALESPSLECSGKVDPPPPDR